MFWRKKESDFEEMDRIIQQNPGLRPADIAQKINVARSTVTRRLASMDEAGYLYSEDEEGGLWPFGRGR